MKTKSGFDDKRLLETFDLIDEKYISETLEHYKDVPDVSGKPQIDKGFVRMTLKRVAVLAACLVLMSALIPAVSLIIGNMTAPVTDGGAGNIGEVPDTDPETAASLGEEETGAPTERVYDGSEGLEYAVNEDGKTASFIGFGTCTEEHIVIASTFRGLPVTEMRNEGLLCGIDPQYCGSNYAKSIRVSETVEEIYQGIFEVCPYLESIYIGSNVKYMRPFVANTWEGYNLAEIKVSPENNYFADSGNCLIEKQSKTLTVACKNSVIPDDGSVEIIGFQAFYGLKPLNPIVIPDCIKRIEGQAFAECELESAVCYKGTVESWNAIEKAADWFTYQTEPNESHLREIVCSDGIAKP